MKKFILSAAITGAIVLSAAAKQPRQSATAVFTVEPAMSCASCENKIKTSLRLEKGVSAIATSLRCQTVTVTFDPGKTNPENLMTAFRKIGYKASIAAGNATVCPENHKCPTCPGKNQ